MASFLSLLSQVPVKTNFYQDSLRQKLTRDSLWIFRKKLAKPFLKIENRFSFISNEKVNLFGIMAGATFIEKHSIFGGYFFLDPREVRPISFEGRKINTEHYLQMRYVVLGYQYVLINKRFFQINIPLSIGFGDYSVRVTDRNDQLISNRSGSVWPMNAGCQLILKPVAWMGFSINSGYRFVAEQENIELSLRGWYYSFGLWIDGRHVYRETRFFNKKRIYKKNLRKAQNF